MTADMWVSYAPADDGGVRLAVKILGTEDELVSLPMDHEGALKMAASILLNAGVSEATFSDGTLHEAARRW